MLCEQAGLICINDSMTMEIQLNFDKKTISPRMYKFLPENMSEEWDRKSILRLKKKKKLTYHDPN